MSDRTPATAWDDFDKDPWEFSDLHNFGPDDPYFEPQDDDGFIVCGCSVHQGGIGPDGPSPRYWEMVKNYEEERRAEGWV